MRNFKKEIAGGMVHRAPVDLQKALIASPAVRAAWETITPLARNDWICWVESAKKSETRNKKIKRACTELRGGKRRPCCWPGCPHR